MTSHIFDNPIAVHVIWHPDSDEAAGIADTLFSALRSDGAQIQGGIGIPVFFYSMGRDGSTGVPPDIDRGAARRCVLLPVIDEHLIDAVDCKPDWRDWFDQATELRSKDPEHVSLIPVTLCEEAIAFCNRSGLPNAIRWHHWHRQSAQEKTNRLLVTLLPMVFDALRSEAGDSVNPDDREKISLFLSHAKADGRDLAIVFRDEINRIPGVADFFDEVDILPGEDFECVLERHVGKAAVLIIHTDSYASRDWCSWEVVTGKRLNVPMVTAHCIHDREHRAFPYLGNVPSVRVGEVTSARVLDVVRRLLEEALRQLLWRCFIAQVREKAPEELRDVIDTWRTPEIVWLMLNQDIAESTASDIRILHPDPPLGRNEKSILEKFKPKISLLTPIDLSI
jgi:hypothetical protein